MRKDPEQFLRRVLAAVREIMNALTDQSSTSSTQREIGRRRLPDGRIIELSIRGTQWQGGEGSGTHSSDGAPGERAAESGPRGKPRRRGPMERR